MPRSRRMRLSASARSPAESASVPSRSNSTTDTGSGRVAPSGIGLAKRREVVDGGVILDAIDARQRVVGHACESDQIETGAPCVARQFRRTNEPAPVVRAHGQKAQQILCTEDRIRVRLWIAIECCEDEG